MMRIASSPASYEHEHGLVEWSLQQMLQGGGWQHGIIWLYEPERNLLTPRLQPGHEPQEGALSIGPGTIALQALQARSVWEGPLAEVPFPPGQHEQDLRTLLIPLAWPDRVLGLAQFLYQEVQRPTPERMRELLPMADVLATLLNNSQLQAEVSLLSSQLQIIQSISGSLTRLQDLDLIANTIPRETKRLIDYHACRVHVVQGDEAIAVAMHSEHEEYTRDSLDQFKVRLGEGLTGWVALHGEGLLLNDASSDPRAVEVEGTDPIDESMILMPMKSDHEVLGVLSVSKLGLGQFGESDARLIRILADQAAVAVRNVRLMDEVKERAREALSHARQTELISELAAVIASTLDPDLLVRRLASAVVDATPADFVIILRLGSEARLRVSAGYGLSDSDWNTLVHSGSDLPLARHVLATRHAYVVHDSAQDPVFAQQKPVLSVRSLAAVPITLADTPLGVLIVGCYERPGAFDREHIQLIEAVSSHAATALGNAEQYERQVRDTEVNGALSDLGQALMASSTEIEVVDASIRTLQRLFEPTGGAIFTRDEQGAWIIQRGWGSEQLSVEKGEHPCLPMYTTDGQVAAHSDNLHICVPLATARGSLGFVSLSFASDDHVASPRRLLLENVCKYIALAISNQRLYTLARVQSVTDALTGLHNYRYLEEFLDQEWKIGRAHV